MPVAVIGPSGLGGVTLFQADLLTLIEPAVFVREAFMHFVRFVRWVSGIHGYSNHAFVRYILRCPNGWRQRHLLKSEANLCNGGKPYRNKTHLIEPRVKKPILCSVVIWSVKTQWSVPTDIFQSQCVVSVSSG